MPPKNDKPGGGGGGGKGGGPKKDTTPPSLEGPLYQPVDENQTFVFDFDTDDVDAVWSLEGVDAALFDIDSNGVLVFRDPPDYEAPNDDNGDRQYDLTVVVTDQAGNSTSQDLIVTLQDVEEDTTAPIIAGPSVVSVNENQTFVANFDADEAGTWSLVGGGDDALFAIDATTGEVTFRDAPDFENPGDAGADNTYDITVAITDDAGNTATQKVSVEVTDIDEGPSSFGFTNLVVFGDSLSDNGNFNALAADFLVRDNNGELIYTVPFQYDGDGFVRTYSNVAFTDGTVYADTLAGLLAVSAGYENYALGGAQALGSKLGADYIQEYANLTYTTLGGGTDSFSIVEDTDAALAAYGDFDINLAAQVDRYLAENSDGVPQGTFAILNIGANDLGEFDTSFFNILLGGIDDFARDLGKEVETQARRLATAGVEALALYRLPVAEFFIGYDDLSWYEEPFARDLIDAVNAEITDAANALNADGIATEVVRLDVMSKELMADMKTYGFLYQGPYLYGYSGDPTWLETSKNVIEPVFDVNATAQTYRPEQILFFDEIHPSGALHDMLAVFSSETFTTDQVFGSGDANTILLGADDDFVVARGGSDNVSLGAGDDVVLGGRGSDTLRGEDGSDLLIGGGAGMTVLKGVLATIS